MASFGPHTRRYLELLATGRRSLKAELCELRCLATVYGAAALEAGLGGFPEGGSGQCTRGPLDMQVNTCI